MLRFAQICDTILGALCRSRCRERTLSWCGPTVSNELLLIAYAMCRPRSFWRCYVWCWALPSVCRLRSWCMGSRPPGSTGSCRASPFTLMRTMTAPASAIVGLSAMAAPGRGISPATHTPKSGDYTITLTVTDSQKNSASFSRTIHRVAFGGSTDTVVIPTEIPVVIQTSVPPQIQTPVPPQIQTPLSPPPIDPAEVVTTNSSGSRGAAVRSVSSSRKDIRSIPTPAKPSRRLGYTYQQRPAGHSAR